jgi:fibronectin type 3 domain-containing protein/predicted esterase
MKKFLIVLLIWGISIVNSNAQYSSSSWSWNIDAFEAHSFKGSPETDNFTMPYRLLKPLTYNPLDQTTRYPMVIMLHGAGEGMGTDCSNQRGNNVCQLGWGGKLELDSLGKYPAFYVHPQTYGGGWSSSDGSGNYTPTPQRPIKLLVELLDSLFKTYPVDLNRVYIHGLSGGGQGVWEMLFRYPGLFAATSPHSATGNLSLAETIIYNPIWTVQGQHDTNPRPENSIKMMDSLRAKGATPILTYDPVTNQQVWPNINNVHGNPIYTYVPNIGHEAWIALYNSPVWLKWMFAQSKLKIKVWNNGDLAICQGGNDSRLLGISPGYEQYEWRKDGVVIPNSNSHTYLATETGAYSVRFKKKKYFFSGQSEWTDWSEPVNIIYKAPTAPVAISQSGSATLPSLQGNTSVILSAPAGYTYLWSTGATTQSITTSTPGVYTVKVTTPGGCQSESSAPVVVTVGNQPGTPEAPINLTAVGISTKKIKLFWEDNSNNETGFEIYHATTAGGPYLFRGVVPANTVTYEDDQLLHNQTYYYKIRAINNFGGSSYTAEKSAKTPADNVLPTTPLNLTITERTSSTVSLTWSASTDNYGLNKYLIYSGDTVLAEANGSPFTVINLKKDTYYALTVRALDNAGLLSNPSNQVSFSTNFNGLEYSYYEGNWSVLPDFASLTPLKTGSIANFSLAPRIKSDYFGFRFKGYINITTAGTYTFYTNSDDGSKLYINNILVVDNDGAHAPQERSGSISLPVGKHAIMVDFFEAAGGEQCDVSYSGPGVNKQIIPNSVLFTGSGATAPTPPAAITSLSAATVSSSKIKVTWTNSASGVKFELYRTNAGGTVNTLIYTGTALTYTDYGLNASTKYYYKVKSISPTGETAYPVIVNATTTPKPVAPNTPGALTAEVLSYDQVKLTWTDSNNEDYYVIERSELNSNNFTPIDSVDANVLQYINAELDSKTSYYYRVIAKNDGGVSGYSSIVNAVTLPNIPLVPTNLSAEVKSVLKINLSWTDNATNEDGFILEKSSYIDSGYVQLAILPANTTTYTDGGVEGATYYYRWKAFNESDGVSEYSAVLTVNVPQAPYAPNSGSWRIAAVDAADNGGDANFVASLKNKQDYLTKLSVAPGTTRTVSVKLPALVNDGMFVFNIENNIESVPVKAFISDNSTDGTNGNWTEVTSPYVSQYENDLQKFDIPQAYGEKWVRLSFTNNSSGIVYLKEFGLYQFSLTGRDNYFLICGASIEEAWGSHNEIKSEIEAAFPGEGYEPVIFNVSVSGQNVGGLASQIDAILARHPHASYVFVHQGGNNVTPRRPMAYSDLFSSYMKVQFENQFNKIAESIINAGKIPVFSRISFRDYKTEPKVNGGLNQEVGSLPFNIVVDNIIQKYTPEFYNFNEKKGRIDLYELTLNNQNLLTAYDGIHPVVSQTDKFIKYWVNTAVRYIYKGEWAPVTPYTEFVPDLHAKATNAVETAEYSHKGIDWYSARILTEQIGNASVRVPLLERLEAIDTNYVPAIPVIANDLTASAESYDKIVLSWSDESDSELGYDIYRATSEDGTFVKVFTTDRNATSFADSTLEQTTTFYYKLKAFNKGGVSEFSNVAYATTFVKPFINTRPAFTPIVNPTVKEANTLVIHVQTNDIDPDTITLKAYGIPHFATFVDSLNGNGKIIVNPGLNDAGTYTISLTSNDGQGGKDSISFDLTVLNNVIETTVYKVHTGGPAISTPPFDWEADTKESPSPYLDPATQNLTQTYNFNAVNNTDAPNQLYSVYRYVQNNVPMQYNFPVANGYYKVKLYFWARVNGVGQRVMNIKLEDVQMLTNFDVYAEGGNDPIMKTLYVNVTDGVLDLDIIRVTGNSVISGVEIVRVEEPAPNQNPVINPIADQYLSANTNASVAINTSDEDGDIASLSVSGLPAFATFTDLGNGKGTIQFNPSEEDAGNYILIVTANDNKGGISTKAFTVNVSATPFNNNVPVINQVAPLSVTVYNVLFVEVTASDEDNDPIVLEASGLPSFVTFVDNMDNTGKLFINPAVGTEGTYTLVITAKDNRGGSSSRNINLTVNPPANRNPILAPVAVQTVTIPNSLSIELLATDPDGDPLTLSVAGLPSFAVFTDSTNGKGSIVVNPALETEGQYTIVVTAADDRGGTASQSITIIVNAPAPPVNNSPVFTAVPTQTVTTPNTLTISISATDEDEDAITLTATGLPSFAAFTDNEDGTGTILVSPTTSSDAGLYSITVTATDARGATSNIVVTLTVQNPDLVIYRVNAGGSVLTDAVLDWATDTKNTPSPYLDLIENTTNLVSGSATYSGVNTTGAPDNLFGYYRYSTTLPLQYNFPVINGTYKVTLYFFPNVAAAGNRVAKVMLEGAEAGPNIDYFAEAGGNLPFKKTYEVTVTDGVLDFDLVRVSNNPTLSGIEIVSVGGSGGISVNHNPVIASIAAQVVTVPNSLLLTITATDEDEDAITLSVSGLPTFATFTDNLNGTGTLEAHPGTNDGGTYNLTVTATDSQGGSSTQNFSITVNVPVNHSPVLTAVTPQTVIVPNSLTIGLAATDEDGDAITLSVSNLPSFAVFTDSANGKGSIVVNPTTGTEGLYEVTVTATDIHGASVSEVVVILISAEGAPVNNVPVITPIAASTVVVPDTLVIPVAAVDPDEDAITLSVSNLPAFATFTDSLNGKGSIVIIPSATDAGTYNLVVVATDSKGVSSNQTVSLTVSLPVVPEEVLYRINAGGNAISDPVMNWSADTKNAPSAYLDLVTNTTNLISGSATYSGINTTDAPNDIFGYYRYSTTLPLEYNFPVANGTYKVKLYFKPNVANLKNRVASISLEDVVVALNMDYYAEGGGDFPFVKTFVVQVNDGVLNFDLIRVTNNPSLSGIEILTTGETAPVRFGQFASAATSSMLDVSLSPNPASEVLYVEFNEEIDQPVKISMIDELGKVALELPAEIYTEGAVKLDISTLTPGMYILNVSMEDGKNKVLKVIKH